MCPKKRLAIHSRSWHWLHTHELPAKAKVYKQLIFYAVRPVAGDLPPLSSQPCLFNLQALKDCGHKRLSSHLQSSYCPVTRKNLAHRRRRDMETAID